jgi:hypothetical protein
MIAEKISDISIGQNSTGVRRYSRDVRRILQRYYAFDNQGFKTFPEFHAYYLEKMIERMKKEL